ncbi:MAG: ATP-dependent DNA helicase [Methanimicrococcus sp.]|nr:ATP-dependent DNA helicase [Methanimicrococcus sp.]
MTEKKSKNSSSRNQKKDFASSKTTDIWLPINDLPFPDRFKSFYTDSGIEKLYPPQTKAVFAGLLENKNVLISIPTASGKTLLSELAMLKSLEGGGKCLYIVPLRALASEKFKRFLEFEKFGFKSGISTGDLDERDENLGQNDIIVATSEKVDSLIRNGTNWLSQISVVVLDEVHLLDSKDRGPTLEIVITKLRKLNPKMQIIALSATIQNSQEVADWLEAECVVSDWRPTKLFEGIYYDGVFKGKTAHTNEQKEKEIEGVGKGKEPGVSLAADVVRDGGQCLVFTNSRKNAVGFAKKAGLVIQSYLTEEERIELSGIAAEITDQSDTDASKTLALCLRSGVAFHHAGLSSSQREIVEKTFLSGKIKLISSTPTLAAGLNLPARRVIIAAWRRYDPNEGMQPISVMEYKQMAGRAGRPHLDPYGESVLIAAKEVDVDKLNEMYIDAAPESVESKLGAENALRTHILSTISNGFAHTREQLLDFFKGTFFAHQKGLLSTIALKTMVDKCLDFLIDSGMCFEDKEMKECENSVSNSITKSIANSTNDLNSISNTDLNKISKKTNSFSEKSGPFVTADKIVVDRFVSDKTGSVKLGPDKTGSGNLGFGKTSDSFPLFATKLGSLVSKLYLDPLSASVLLENIQKAEKSGMELTDISLLHLICVTTDMHLLYLKSNDYMWIVEFAAENQEHFISMPSSAKASEFEWFLGELKTAVLLYRWISEVPENDISKEFDVGEGDIRQFSETAAWIANAGARLLKTSGLESGNLFSDLELRLKYGASIELLPLLKIRGIGRVRARKLYSSGFKSKESFKPADFVTVSGLIGPKIAEALYREIGIDPGGYAIFDKKKRIKNENITRNESNNPEDEIKNENEGLFEKTGSAQIQKRFDDFFK